METKFRKDDVFEIECLNRTMQYGNYTSLLKRMCGFECLNRTMQYGNI